MKNTYLVGPSEKELTSEMHHKGSIINGWDAVISISQDLINANLSNANKNVPFIDTLSEIMVKEDFPGGISVFTKFSAKLSSPSVHFHHKDKMVDILTNIQAGEYQKGTKIGETPIIWDEKKQMPEGAYIKNSVKYESLIEGSTITLFVSLFGSSACLFGVDKVIDIAAFNEKLTEYFKGLDLKYTLLKADLSSYQSLFKIGKIEVSTSITNSNTPTLHLFVAAIDNMKLQPYLAVDNCIPKGYCGSVILNSKYVFKTMLLEPLSESETLQFTLVDPKNNYESFYGSAKKYIIEEQVDFSSRPDLRITPTSNLISLNLEGMQLTSTANSGICFRLNKTILQDYQIHHGPIPLWKSRNIKLDIEITSELPLVISYEKEEPEINLQFGSLSLNVSPSETNGQYTCEDFSTFAAPFQKAIEALLSAQIKNTDFGKAPALAAKLLPSIETKLTKAYIPGDLLLLISPED